VGKAMNDSARSIFVGGINPHIHDCSCRMIEVAAPEGEEVTLAK
jgi:hypothetical protein